MKPAIALVLIGLSSPPMLAMAGPRDHGMGSMQGMENMPMSEGVIRKVDKSTSKITIRHSQLYNLGVPAMLNQVKPGYAMRFRANRVKGSPSIT
jgi:Cu/Ag efflux protein CusF